MDELSKTFTLTHAKDGWRVHFASGIAPGFGLEPHNSLFEVIGRVETLYPEYRPRLTIEQLVDYQIEVTRRGYAQELQKIISQASDLKDGLIDLTKKLPQIGAGQDRGRLSNFAPSAFRSSSTCGNRETRSCAGEEGGAAGERGKRSGPG
jgi:hypothetical protein